MENIKWLRLSALGCFLLIFGSTIGTYIFNMLWIPRVFNLTSEIIHSFTSIFELTSYFVLGGGVIILISLIFIVSNHIRIGIAVMLIGLVIALLAMLLYLFGAFEAASAYTMASEKLIVFLPLLTINFTFEVVGLILIFLSRIKLAEQHILQFA